MICEIWGLLGSEDDCTSLRGARTYKNIIKYKFVYIFKPLFRVLNWNMFPIALFQKRLEIPEVFERSEWGQREVERKHLQT
jgi:hypothetical protein